MAYKKRTSYRKRAPKTMGLAKKVRTLTKKVNKLPTPELKYNDNGRQVPASVGYDINTVTDALITPAEGDTNITREGSQLNAVSLHIRGRVTASTSQLEPATIRILLIQAKQRYVPSSVATSGVTQLFENANTNDAVHSMFSFTNRIHYRVLKDFKIRVQDPSADATNTDQKYFQMTYKFKKFNKVIAYDDSTTTAQKNQVYLVAISTSSTANYPSIEYSARTTFYDS